MTYNQIIDTFETIATNHPQIHNFGDGLLEDINTIKENGGKFPVLWVIPQTAVLGENGLKYVMRVLVFDIDETADTFRRNILSDTLSIINDVIKEFKNGDDDYYVGGDNTAFPFTQNFADYVTGWYIDLGIETGIDNNPCDVPE